MACKFFVQRKKRYCKMLVKPGQELCGEHQKVGDAAETDENNANSPMRILCPLDKKHTVYAHNLKKHLKICNARQSETKPYIEKDVNSGKSEVSVEATVNDTYQMLCTFPKNHILDVIKKVYKVSDKCLEVPLDSNPHTHPLVEEEMKNPDYGEKTKKHLKQASAILGLLEKFKMLRDKTCYIEFGAGRGQLSCWVAEATEALNDCRLLLIERASPKHKRDNKLAKTSDRIYRIRADISDLILDKLDTVSKTENVVGVTKHLCGDATDLALRCLTSLHNKKNNVAGVLFTFCCHHRCRWTPYTGKEFFKANGLNAEDFNIMCGLSSWATCGLGYSREYREKIKNNEQGKIIDEKDMEYDLSRSEREDIGRRCKHIINSGRLHFLQQNNFDCSFRHYVDKFITLENVCIIALQKNSIE